MKIKVILPLAFLAIAVLLSFGFFTTSGQEAKVISEVSGDHINWVTIEEAEELAQKDNKKILVDAYTAWCGWCKVMDKKTYEDPGIVKYINENYHAVKFDAEQKEEINLGGRTFKHLPNAGRNGIHELAIAMLGNRPSYPTTVFFDEKLQKLTNVPGYLKPEDMMPILTYFAEDVHKTGKNINAYMSEYNKGK